MRSVAWLLCVLLVPLLASAQSPQSPSDTAGDVDSLPIPAWAKTVLDRFEKPLHPVIGGVASSGGLGFGIGYDSPAEGQWYGEADAMVTVRRNWLFAGEVGRRSRSKRSRLGAFAGVRHMNRIDYFGIGPATTFDDRSAFRLREVTAGTRGWHRLTPAVRLGGAVALYVPEQGVGANRSVPSIERVFSESTVPGGFATEPKFARYRGFAEYMYPALANPDSLDESNRYRGAYQVAVEAARDLDGGSHSFHRWETEVQQRIPGFRPGQRLTLHGFLASTNSGADVPFYMLYTLGGSGGLKAFRDDLLGSDGTRATLRGFHNYRFRDRDLVLMQAEYRIPLHRYVHTTVFVDSGQVAPHTSALFQDLRTTTGFSLSYMRKGRTVGRMDVGFGGGEGVLVFWSFGMFDR
jgi:hypothetical protein